MWFLKIVSNKAARGEIVRNKRTMVFSDDILQKFKNILIAT